MSNFDHAVFVHSQDLAARKEAEATLAAIAKRLANGYEPSQMKIVVYIGSSWADEGEQNVKAIGETLEIALKKAQDDFKRINRRSDIQGFYSVYVEHAGTSFHVPEEHYRDLI